MTKHKPVIETIINTSAIALTAFGVSQIVAGRLSGYLALGVGVLLELLKYHGRNKNYW